MGIKQLYSAWERVVPLFIFVTGHGNRRPPSSNHVSCDPQKRTKKHGKTTTPASTLHTGKVGKKGEKIRARPIQEMSEQTQRKRRSNAEVFQSQNKHLDRIKIFPTPRVARNKDSHRWQAACICTSQIECMSTSTNSRMSQVPEMILRETGV